MNKGQSETDFVLQKFLWLVKTTILCKRRLLSNMHINP